MQQFVLARHTTIGFVALRVHTLKTMVNWYQEALGMTMLQDAPGRVLLGLAGTRHVLSILESGGRLLRHPPAGLAGFVLHVPTLEALSNAAARVQTQVAHPLVWFETGFSRGFVVEDPEHNEVRVEFDRGLAVQFDRRYDFADLRTKVAKPPKLAGDAQATLVAGTRVSRLTVRTPDVLQTVAYLHDVLGFVVQTKSQTAAFLTVGDAAEHISIAVLVDDKARPRLPEHAGGRYVSLFVPTEQDLLAVVANVRKHKWPDYWYAASQQYLMVTGPNRLTIWFSVGLS